ncbi:MAG: TolC family protein [Thiohalomonadales bacterium]
MTHTRPSIRLKYFAFKLIAMSCLPLPVNTFAGDLSFSQAWQLLQSNNDGLAASKENKAKSIYMQEAAKAMFYPQIDLKGGYTRLNDNVSLAPSQLFEAMPAGESLAEFFATLGPTAGTLDDAFTARIADQDVLTASLSLLWPIYTGGRILAAQDIAAGQLMEAEYLLRFKQQILFERLVKFYFGVVLTSQVLLARTDTEQGLSKHLHHAQKLEQQGQIPRVERLKAEASHAKAKVEKNKAQRTLEVAQIALRRLLHADAGINPISPLFINDAMPPLAPLSKATLENHPGLGVLKAKQTQAQGLVEVKQAAYLPEAFLFGNYNVYEQETLAAELAPDWLVGIGLKMPLLSRSGRSGKLQAAKSTLIKLDLLKAQARTDLGLLVEKTWREAQIAQEEYTGLAISLELAHESIRMREVAFTQGLSTSLEVIDAQLFLVNVKTQRQAAAYEYVLSLARLLALSNQMIQFSDYQKKGIL